ncbi:protein-L-isoaspartate(D-aspartate) O-methyltransferase [Pontibaca sp. S1109L]|uniref:Protein-L-isoaspartate O-methyltransferase n=2 Tax=Pontibaca salina TaxID=2795731 RepID=A0A934HPB8_9RHOB|nr:protein-L-isoaspartate(D-aspartate) O-methyltransferase [Pontibaca salina]
MVDQQIAGRGIRDRHVLAAMRKVPRESFVSPEQSAAAYGDHPLPIGQGQTISQPYIVARMIEAARIGPDQRVLEIGAGSGYAAAVIAEIADDVYTVERHQALGASARARLQAAGYNTVHVQIADGTLGWPDAAPYDAIIVAAGAPSVPQALKEQLREGGRLIIPVGTDSCTQTLTRLTRTGPEEWCEERLASVRFVPLIGAQGWT